MTTIYGYNAGASENSGYLVAQAISEDGVLLPVRHHCPSEDQMPHGLGMDGVSVWQHDVYEKMFPEGFTCEFVPTKEMKKHTGLTKAFYLQQQQREAVEKKRSEPVPAILITKGKIEECK